MSPKQSADAGGISFLDLGTRWAQARIAALRTVLVSTSTSVKFHDEQYLLSIVPAAAHDHALRAVFDNSRRLGRSASLQFGTLFEIDDFQSFLGFVGSSEHVDERSEGLHVPCLGGTWKTSATGARTLTRQGCQAKSPTGFFCSWWREAIDGLVMGLGDETRFVRHGSLGNSDDQCTDVFFDEQPVGGTKTHWGPVPPLIADSLKPVAEKFTRLNVTLNIDGYADGRIFYRIAPPSGLYHELFKGEVARRLPHVRVQDVAPRAPV